MKRRTSKDERYRRVTKEAQVDVLGCSSGMWSTAMSSVPGMVCSLLVFSALYTHKHTRKIKPSLISRDALIPLSGTGTNTSFKYSTCTCETPVDQLYMYVYDFCKILSLYCS